MVRRRCGSEGNGLPAFLDDFLSNFLKLVFHSSHIHEHHLGVFLSESPSNRRAHASTAANHNRYLTLQFHGHSSCCSALNGWLRCFVSLIISQGVSPQGPVGGETSCNGNEIQSEDLVPPGLTWTSLSLRPDCHVFSGTTARVKLAREIGTTQYQSSQKRFLALYGDAMGFYKNVIVPRLCDLVMRNNRLMPYRERVIGVAEGRVLEIGAGSGLNIRLYKTSVSEVLALEPDPKLIAMAERSTRNAVCPVRFLEASAEHIPLDEKSVDTVVTTWALCTIPDAVHALEEMHRVLKPNGKLLFVEHGLAPEQSVQKWQNRLTPIWKRISGGCHLNRPIDNLIEKGGFKIDVLETGYLPGPKMMKFLYEGLARPS